MKKCAFIRVDFQRLADFLDLPEGLEIVSVGSMPDDDALKRVRIYVRGVCLPSDATVYTDQQVVMAIDLEDVQEIRLRQKVGELEAIEAAAAEARNLLLKNTRQKERHND